MTVDSYIGYLMIDTSQALLSFRLKDERAAPHHPGVFYFDYMMNIRTLLFNETVIDFHMVMGKGDSVLVGGLSYNGSDDKRAAAKCEEGDYVLHHTVTVGIDTTQGGAETYAALYAHIGMLHKLVPDLTSLSIISDTGSGFKATVAVLGLLYLSHKDFLPGNKNILTWMYPDAGEGDQPEIDGMMLYLKQNRRKHVQ